MNPMLRRLAPLVALAAITAPVRADDQAGDTKADNKLVGTWKLVSARYGGNERALPEEMTTLKHVTPSQFMWASYGEDGRLIRAAGGSYSIDGENYVETPEYGLSSDFDLIKGKSQKFKWRVEGDKWYHDGELSNGLTIEEVWERVGAK